MCTFEHLMTGLVCAACSPAVRFDMHAWARTESSTGRFITTYLCVRTGFQRTRHCGCIQFHPPKRRDPLQLALLLNRTLALATLSPIKAEQLPHSIELERTSATYILNTLTYSSTMKPAAEEAQHQGVGLPAQHELHPDGHTAEAAHSDHNQDEHHDEAALHKEVMRVKEKALCEGLVSELRWSEDFYDDQHITNALPKLIAIMNDGSTSVGMGEFVNFLYNVSGAAGTAVQALQGAQHEVWGDN